MTTERRKLMIETRNRVQKEFKKLRQETHLNSDVAGRIFFLMDRRVRTFGVRSFFVETVYKYVVEQAELEKLPLASIPSDIFDTKLPLLAEGIITVQYYHNQILDGKGGLYDTSGNCNKTKIDNNLIAGNYVKDFLYNYIEESIFPNDLEKSRIITKAIRRIFQYVDLGQDMQDRLGTSEAYSRTIKQSISVTPEIDSFIDQKLIDEFWNAIHKQGVSDEKEWFVRNYLLRINLTTASLFAILAEMVMDLLGYKGKERNNIIKLSAANGIVEQIVNDNNDYVLPEIGMRNISKIPNDAFADLRNDNITLPLIFHLEQEDNGIESMKVMQRSFKVIDSLVLRLSVAILGWLLTFIGALSKDFKSKIRIYYSKIIANNNKKNFASLQRNLFPSIKRSIDVAKIMASQIKELKLVEKNSLNGALLLDMNSITAFDTNRYYRHIYASMGEEMVSEVQNQNLTQVNAEELTIDVRAPDTFFNKRFSKIRRSDQYLWKDVIERLAAQISESFREIYAFASGACGVNTRVNRPICQSRYFVSSDPALWI